MSGAHPRPQNRSGLLEPLPPLRCGNAKAGLIPGAKPGKRRVFLEVNLVVHLQSLCPCPGQAPLSGCGEGNALGHSTNAAIPGGSASQRPMASEYAALPGLETSSSRRNTPTN
jgi:hypothetical protein